MPWWFAFVLLAIFAVVLAAMPWKRPHPNHLFTLEMLECLADKDSPSVSESRCAPGLRETVSSAEDKGSVELQAATLQIKRPTS